MDVKRVREKAVSARYLSRRTSKRGLPLTIGILVMLSVTGSTFMCCAQLPPEGDDGVRYVLLKNSNVLRGKLDMVRDRISVRLDEGSSLQIRKEEVVYIGFQLRELYDYQYAQNLRWGTGEHLHFANWCIRNGLLLEAEQHYQYLKREIGSKPEFRQLEQYYRQALLENSDVRSAAGLESVKPSESNSEVVQASATVRTARNPLDTMNLSPASLSEFRTRLLPMLESRCGQPACHGEYSKTPLQLYSLNRRSSSATERSIESVMAYLRPEAPTRSKLIEMAITPHGLQAKRGFDPTNQQDRQFLERLQTWIGMVGTNQDFRRLETTTSTTGTVGRVGELQERMRLQSEFAQFAAAQSESQLNSNLDHLSDATISRSEIEQLEAEIARLELLEAKGSTENDPFDPEQFNRQRTAGGAPR